MEIRDKVVIVTGGGRGIGQAIALELARLGARVVCVARGAEQLHETVRQIEAAGGTALALTADVKDRRQVEAMVYQTIEAYGAVDVLINNAASFEAVGAVWEVDVDKWWNDMSTNLLGPFLCSRAVLPGMMERNEGIIVNLFGGGGGRAFPGASGYGSSKAALMRLTDTLAFELQTAKCNVHVYGYDPGLVQTAMSAQIVQGKAGDRWMQVLRELLEKGETHPAEDAAESLAKLLMISRPELSGRIFAYHHDFDEIVKRAAEIKVSDSFQIRYV